MENPKYILVMRQVASDYDGISHELFQIANNLERMDQFNPQQKLFSLVRNAEVSTVSLRNLTARTVRDDTAHFYGEVADLLGIRIDETHDWLKITVPAILPKRNQRDNQAFLTRPLRYALLDFLKENPMERFGSCAICIVHNYDEALGKRRIRDYDNIETKRYLDVIESTGTAPAKTQSVAVGAKKADYTQADVMPEPKAGDKIPCSDGYVYEITDVSKYQNSMFATQETDTLPDPTCDWSLLDQPTLPEPEANHFTSGGKEYMFVRNLFETRRMQYTLYNAIGDNPQTWQNGKPVTRADGSPLVTVKLSIPESVAANSFWPWRSDQIVELFNSCPPGEYAFEAWDVYCDGAFQYTEYYISVK